VSIPLRGPFRFDTERHVYTVGATVVPGTHTVLGTRKTWLDEDYLARGKAVHAATLHYDLTGDVCALPEEWQPFLRAYVDLRASVSCKWRLLEQPKVHRLLRFATMIDRVGRVNGYEAVVELKTGAPDTFHGPQLAGADLLLPGGGVHSPRQRLGFYLFKDGRFRVKTYNNPADYVTFLNALQGYWGTNEHGKESSIGGGQDCGGWD
jgi:hypothetical protein